MSAAWNAFLFYLYPEKQNFVVQMQLTFTTLLNLLADVRTVVLPGKTSVPVTRTKVHGVFKLSFSILFIFPCKIFALLVNSLWW